MQTSQIVPQACIFRLYSSHVGFTHNLIAIWNKSWINTPTIGDIEVTLPLLNDRLAPLWAIASRYGDRPQGGKRFGTMAA